MDLAVNPQRDMVRRTLAEHLVGFGLAPVTSIQEQADVLRARRAGKIVTCGGRLVGVFGRWWPYLGNHFQTLLDRQWRPLIGDRCELYFHAPLSSPGFLTLSYVHSGDGTSLSTFYAATLVLDEIARLKRSVAIVSNVTNDRISDRLLQRWGWEAHCLEWSGRHFIKRFYGEYPEIALPWRKRLEM